MSQRPQPIVKVLQTHSERVKSVDLHPKEPLVLCSLYSGQVTLWNFETQALSKAFDVSESQNRDPVRCAKFIPRLNSFVCGADDLFVRVFNYNTMERTKVFEAHSDYIRSMAVHDVLPYLLTASDDMSIRMWDWSKNWQLAMVFEGHTHYVMSVVFNPKDTTTFASASLDTFIMVWSVTSNQRNFTLEGHESGVNCVEYFSGGDKPYLVSGGDDHTVRVWDYQTKACLQTLSYHEKNITCVSFHPTMPLLFAGSEDETVSVFSTQTWRLDQCMNFGLERIWQVACKKGTGHVAVGCDHGMIVLRVGQEEPAHSMDSAGKILVSSNTEILRMDVKQSSAAAGGSTAGGGAAAAGGSSGGAAGAGGEKHELADGEVVQLPSRELGSMESPPTRILHSPNGQYAAVLFGEDEYTVNSTLSWRPKCFGKAIAFAWGSQLGTFAILENSSTLRVFHQFKAADSIRLPGNADALFSGTLLGVRIDDAVLFLSWEGLIVIRRILEKPKSVVWSDSGELCAILTDDASFILKCNIDHVLAYVQAGANSPDGTDESFDLVEELENKIRQAIWVGDFLVFCDMQERLNFYIGGEVDSLAVLPRAYFILGYVARDNRIYCIDRERNVIGFHLHGSHVDYLTAIVREEFDRAAELLPSVPTQVRYKIARLLQSRELPHIAIDVTTDDDHKFELAVVLKRLDLLQEFIRKAPTQTKWRQLGDIALQLGEFETAERAMTEAGDYSGLLTLHTCTGNRDGLARVAADAYKKRRFNVAFTAFHSLAEHSRAVDCLIASSMFAEAAFYARTYIHSRIMDAVTHWRQAMTSQPKVREAIADPQAYPNLFPGVDLSPARDSATSAAGGGASAGGDSPNEQQQQSQEESPTRSSAGNSPSSASQNQNQTQEEEQQQQEQEEEGENNNDNAAEADEATTSTPAAVAPLTSPTAADHHEDEAAAAAADPPQQQQHQDPQAGTTTSSAAGAGAAAQPPAPPPKPSPFDDDDDLFGEP